MSDMNKKELLEEDLIDELELAFNQKIFVAKEKYPYRVERILQALAQLKRIVEQYFEIPDTSKEETVFEAIMINLERQQGELNRLKKEQQGQGDANEKVIAYKIDEKQGQEIKQKVRAWENKRRREDE